MKKIGYASIKAIWLWLFTVLLNSSSWALPLPCSSTKFDDYFIDATAEYRRDFNKPEWSKAQACQESHFKVDAVSPVGAQGLLQVMPATYAEILRNLHWDSRVSAFDPERAIRAGVWYQARQFRIWGANGRTPEERNRLGLAGYNAGPGSILKAQKACADALLWDLISPCLIKITGKYSHETITYVDTITLYATQVKLHVRP